VTYAVVEEKIDAPQATGRFFFGRCVSVLLGALFLAWPALYNRFPLLYPDSMTYLDDGRLVARALFLNRFSDYYGVRSLIYSLGILPFHWNITVWPVVALQCLLVAWVVWLVVRSISPRRTAVHYLILMALLSLLTGLSWYADFIMPDVLGPVLYLCIYLLVFADLSRGERLTLYLIAWWAVTAHATHLLLAAGLCLLLALFVACDRKSRSLRWPGLGQTAAILTAAVLAQLALNGYLDGKPSLNGKRPPPYLTARIIADGPGRLYLESHCATPEWALCGHLRELSSDQDEFLWGPDGIYENATEAEKDRIQSEEMPFVRATLHSYPRAQFARSLSNFREQLQAFGVYGFDSSPWLLAEFDTVLPQARARYLGSLQARDRLPLELFSTLQFWTVLASLAGVALLMPRLWRRRTERLAGLTLVVFSIVVANAALTGILSVVDDRYGCRVIWMIPLLAGLFIMDWRERRHSSRFIGTP